MTSTTGSLSRSTWKNATFLTRSWSNKRKIFCVLQYSSSLCYPVIHNKSKYTVISESQFILCSSNILSSDIFKIQVRTAGNNSSGVSAHDRKPPCRHVLYSTEIWSICCSSRDCRWRPEMGCGQQSVWWGWRIVRYSFFGKPVWFARIWTTVFLKCGTSEPAAHSRKLFHLNSF